MSDCPYCGDHCIAIDDRDGSCYVKNCVEIGLECQSKMAAEIEKLRAQLADMTSILGVAAVGKSFAEITKDLRPRAGESD